MRKTRIFIDMDGVLAQWNSVSIEAAASKGYFRNLLPQTPMVEAVKALIADGYDVHILSSVFNDDHSIEEKNAWLDGYFPKFPKEKRIFVPFGVNKSEVVPDRTATDVLIDDYTQNLNKWHGVGIKCMNGINGTKGTWRGYQVNGLAYPYVIKQTIAAITDYVA